MKRLDLGAADIERWDITYDLLRHDQYLKLSLYMLALYRKYDAQYKDKIDEYEQQTVLPMISAW